MLVDKTRDFWAWPDGRTFDGLFVAEWESVIFDTSYEQVSRVATFFYPTDTIVTILYSPPRSLDLNSISVFWLEGPSYLCTALYGTVLY